MDENGTLCPISPLGGPLMTSQSQAVDYFPNPSARPPFTLHAVHPSLTSPTWCRLEES